MATKQRYPLSTPSGQAIPLDVIRPTKLLSIAFSSVSSSSPIALPAGTEILLVRATASCFVRFDNSLATKPDGAGSVVEDTLYLEAGEVQIVSPPSLFCSVIGASENGILTVQMLEAWTGLITEHQLTRI